VVLYTVFSAYKDNIDTFDKMHTTAGSLAMMGNIAEVRCFFSSKIACCGCCNFGKKLNLIRWANFRSTPIFFRME
jgi:amidase